MGMHNKLLLLIANCYESNPLSPLGTASTRWPSLSSWVEQFRVRGWEGIGGRLYGPWRLSPHSATGCGVWQEWQRCAYRYRGNRQRFPPGELKSLQISMETVAADPDTGRGHVRLGFASPDHTYQPPPNNLLHIWHKIA